MESCNGVEVETPQGSKAGRMVGATEDGQIRVRHDDGTESSVSPDKVEAVASSIRIPFTDIQIPIRFDGFARLMLSKSNTIRKLVTLIAEDPVGGNGMNSMMEKDFIQNRLLNKLGTATNTAVHEFFINEGISVLKRPQAEKELMENLSRYIRGDESVLPKNPKSAQSFKEAADEVRNVLQDALKLAKEEGIEGVENISFDQNYITRSFNHANMQRLIATHGMDNINELVAQSIYSKRIGSTTLDEARAIAKGYVSTLIRLPYDSIIDDAIHFGARNKEILKNKLTKELGLDPKVADEVSSMIAPDTTGGREGFTKYRTLLDENFSMELPKLDGTGTTTVRLDEMFNNDARELAANYVNKIAGLVALKRKGNLHDDDVWNAILSDAKLEYAAAGVDPAKVIKEIEMINGFRNYVLGRPMLDKPFGTFERVARGILGVNYIRFMGQAGFAQMAELGAIMGMFGTSATLKHMPTFREILRTGITGKAANDQLAKDFAAMGLTSSVESLLPHSLYRKLEDSYHHPYMTKAENYLDMASNATSIVSGMRVTQEHFRRLSERALIQHIYDNAKSGEVSAMIKRMTASGIPEEELQKTMGHASQYIHADASGVVNHIDWERWVKENPDTAAYFQLATYRESRRALMTYKPSELPWFMHSTTGKILMQFRNFAMVSHAKLFLNGLSHKDSVLAMTALMSSTMGSLSYVAQTMVNYHGDQEELDKRLAPTAIITSGIQRAGIFGMVPQAIDNTLYLAGQDPLFNGRTTQQANSGVMSNPTASTIAGFSKMTHDTSEIFSSDRQMTSKDARNYQRQLLGNNLPMTALGQMGASMFPEKSNPVLVLSGDGSDIGHATFDPPKRGATKSPFGN